MNDKYEDLISQGVGLMITQGVGLMVAILLDGCNMGFLVSILVLFGIVICGVVLVEVAFFIFPAIRKKVRHAPDRTHPTKKQKKRIK